MPFEDQEEQNQGFVDAPLTDEGISVIDGNVNADAVLGEIDVFTDIRDGQEEIEYEYLPDTDSYRLIKGENHETVIIPDTYLDKPITEIGENAFQNFTSLKKIDMPSNENFIIRKNAFTGCDNLRYVLAPMDVTIESQAFYGCNRLFDFRLLNPGAVIAEDAFDKDAKVIIFTDMYMPELDARGIYNFPIEMTGYEKIAGVSYLTGTVTDFDDSTNEVLVNSQDRDKTPTQTIGHKAFYGCGNVTTVELPDTVKAIETKAFYGCTNLKKITIPASVTSISEDAFESTPGVSIYAPKDSYAAKYAQAHGIPLNADSQFPEVGNLGVKVNLNMVTVNVTDLKGDGYDCILGTDVSNGKPVRGKGRIAKSQIGKKVVFRNVPKGTYYVGIRPYINIESGKKYGEWSSVKTVRISVTTPARPKIKSAKVSGKNLTVKLSLPKGAARYNLVLGKAFTSNDNSTAAVNYPSKAAYQKKAQKKTNIKLTKLKKGTYYLGIQAYSVQNGKKIYGQWSALKKVKITK